VVIFTPLPLHPQRKSPWYPLDRRLGRPQRRHLNISITTEDIIPLSPLGRRLNWSFCRILLDEMRTYTETEDIKDAARREYLDLRDVNTTMLRSHDEKF
jgi:hypothetical protein